MTLNSFSLEDLRSSSSREGMVSTKEGRELAGRLRISFCETSSLTQTGLKECFDTAVSLGVSIEGVANNNVSNKDMATNWQNTSLLVYIYRYVGLFFYTLNLYHITTYFPSSLRSNERQNAVIVRKKRNPMVDLDLVDFCQRRRRLFLYPPSCLQPVGGTL